jgi:hypothetical protein
MRKVIQNDFCDQIPGNDKKHIDAGETSREPEISMEKYDSKHSDGP